MADTIRPTARQAETDLEAAQIRERAEQLARLLPGVLRRTRSPGRDDPLSALLAAMAEMLLGREQVLDDLGAHYDPERAPLDSLLYLAYWVDLEPLIAPDGPPGLGWLARKDRAALVQENLPTGVDRLRARVEESFPTGIDCLRALVSSAPLLIQQRGTPQGLECFLETATGWPGFRVIESAERPFHICVICPDKARPHKEFVERIIAYQKPAYLTHEVVYKQDENERGQCHE